ncbi:MAG: hypothetical protein QXM43_02490 [Desulfurococcaceae archaeon]
MLEIKRDFPISAALEGQIHKGNANNIKAEIIVEGAKWSNNAGGRQNPGRKED